jgi:integrase
MSVHRVQRPNGKPAYKVRWREGNANRSRQFDRLQDARDFEARVRRERQTGDLSVLTAGGRRLSDYAARWWSDYAEPNLTPRTLEVYATQLDLRIIPHLGGHRLRELTPGVVQELLARLVREGVGDPSIVKTATVLQSILGRAVIDGLIARNPVAVVRKPSQRRKRQPIMVAPQSVERVRANLGQRDATLVSVLAYAGLRPESEAITLTWAQIGNRTLAINASKTGRQRNVRMLAPLAEDLDAWREASGERPGSGLVFPASGGAWTRSDWRNWVRRVWRPATAKAGLDPTARPRDLRGSFASLLIYEGRNVIEVADQLGHSPQTCLQNHAGLFAEVHPNERVDAEAAIARARGHRPGDVPHMFPRPFARSRPAPSDLAL